MEKMKVINTAESSESPVKKVLYTGKVHVTGGRDGYAQSDDGRLQTNLTTPGSSDAGTNPEQLFAAGWSACFIGAMKLNAAKLRLTMPEDVSLDTEIDLAAGEEGFMLQARLHINLPGLTLEQAKQLAEAAHQTCPYSKATRGNINVQIDVTV